MRCYKLKFIYLTLSGESVNTSKVGKHSQSFGSKNLQKKKKSEKKTIWSQMEKKSQKKQYGHITATQRAHKVETNMEAYIENIFKATLSSNGPN